MRLINNRGEIIPFLIIRSRFSFSVVSLLVVFLGWTINNVVLEIRRTFPEEGFWSASLWGLFCWFLFVTIAIQAFRQIPCFKKMNRSVRALFLSRESFAHRRLVAKVLLFSLIDFFMGLGCWIIVLFFFL